MHIVLSILSAIIGLFGLFVIYAGVTSKSIGSILGGSAYLLGAYFAYTNESFWPLAIAFGFAIVLKVFGLDPSR